jgi:hypothetical protein
MRDPNLRSNIRPHQLSGIGNDRLSRPLRCPFRTAPSRAARPFPASREMGIALFGMGNRSRWRARSFCLPSARGRQWACADRQVKNPRRSERK